VGSAISRHFAAARTRQRLWCCFEDGAALRGLLIALAGIAGTQILQVQRLDAIASLDIGAVRSSILLARETEDFLIGEPTLVSVRASLLRIASADPGIRTANGVFTVQLGPNQILTVLRVDFEDALTTTDIAAWVNRVESAISWRIPTFRSSSSSRRRRRHGSATPPVWQPAGRGVGTDPELVFWISLPLW
jgi:hypothetical protein